MEVKFTRKTDKDFRKHRDYEVKMRKNRKKYSGLRRLGINVDDGLGWAIAQIIFYTICGIVVLGIIVLLIYLASGGIVGLLAIPFIIVYMAKAMTGRKV